jgi:hypothetical protein
VACPCFYPVARLLGWLEPPLLPLGDPYEGVCHAVPGEEWVPGEIAVRDFCNMGYARGKCTRFPMNGSPDAVRFTAVHAAGGALEIRYAIEREHAPAGHGVLRYSVSSQTIEQCEDPLLRRQAESYAASYLRRK